MNIILVEMKHFVFKIESTKGLSRAYSVKEIPKTDNKDGLIIIRRFKGIPSRCVDDRVC